LGGSSLIEPFSYAAAILLVVEWLESIPGAHEVVAFDFAMPFAIDLQRTAHCPLKLGWIEANRVDEWPVSEDKLDDLEIVDDGTHLTKLWAHLRRRDMVSPTDVRRARSAGTYLSSEELDEAILCFGVEPALYSRYWNLATNAARNEQFLSSSFSERFESLEEASGNLVGSGSAHSKIAISSSVQRSRSRVTRHYVEVSRGRVHLRRAGDGDRLLLAFLAGAGSSINLEPLLTGLSHSRLVVAPDYIGQGDSCRDTVKTSIEELARDADEIASALGFSSYDVYGTHTGAGVAIEAAISNPDRIKSVIIDGISMQDPSERSEHREKYFPSIEPDLWGTHVHKAWHVRRDGGYFWPWYRPEPAAARSGRAPTLPLLHDRVISTLRSRTTPAYQAIASYAAALRLPLLTQPALFVAGPSDTFVSHMDAARGVAPSQIQFRHVPATVWFAGQKKADIDTTLHIFEEFLDSVPSLNRS
jgi:pimeloyl-ACP methyl ester carboxylesterase